MGSGATLKNICFAPGTIATDCCGFFFKKIIMPGIAEFWGTSFPISPFPRQLPFPGPLLVLRPGLTPPKGHFQHILSTSQRLVIPNGSFQVFLPTFLICASKCPPLPLFPAVLSANLSSPHPFPLCLLSGEKTCKQKNQKKKLTVWFCVRLWLAVFLFYIVCVLERRGDYKKKKRKNIIINI